MLGWPSGIVERQMTAPDMFALVRSWSVRFAPFRFASSVQKIVR